MSQLQHLEQTMTLPRLYHEWEHLRNTTDTSKWTILDVKAWLDQWECNELLEMVVEYAFYVWNKTEKKGNGAATTTKATILENKSPVFEIPVVGDLISFSIPHQLNHPLPQPAKKGTLRAEASIFVPSSTTTKKKQPPNHKLAKFHINQVNKGVEIPKDTPVKARVKNAETRLKAFGRSYTQSFDEAKVLEGKALVIRLVTMILQKKKGTIGTGIQNLVDRARKYEEKARETRAQGEQNKVFITGHKLQLKAQKEAQKKAKKEAAERKGKEEVELAEKEPTANLYFAELEGLVI